MIEHNHQGGACGAWYTTGRGNLNTVLLSLVVHTTPELKINTSRRYSRRETGFTDNQLGGGMRSASVMIPGTYSRIFHFAKLCDGMVKFFSILPLIPVRNTCQTLFNMFGRIGQLQSNLPRRELSYKPRADFHKIPLMEVENLSSITSPISHRFVPCP